MTSPPAPRGAFRVPMSILRGRRPDWPLVDAAGAPLPPRSDAVAGYLLAEPTRLVAPFLRAHLTAIMADTTIPHPDRAWALHRSLLFEMVALSAGDYRRPPAPSLSAAIDEIVREAARLARGDASPQYAHRSLMSTEYALTVHQVETALYAAVLAGILGIQRAEVLRDIALAGLFADAGLSRVPRPLLRATGPLTDAQWAQLRRHPRHSANILLVSGLATAGSVRAVLAHHERWDGGGYPLGMEQEEIPLAARLVSIADTYSAMTVRRPAQPARSPREAMEGMISAQGQFQPSLLRAFVELMGRHRAAAAA